MAQNQTSYGDEPYSGGVPDPNELLSEQQASYAQELARSHGSAQAGIAIASGLQNFNGGGPQMQEAQMVQSRMRQILQTVNDGADPNEDPLTKQMRIAQAMQSGLMAVSPRAAMAAGDKTVEIAQAQKQQALLNTKQQEAQVSLDKSRFDFGVEQNTPQTVVLARSLGKDQNGLDQGFEEYKSYDATDPASAAKMRADMQAAQDQGINVTPMKIGDLINGKNQAAITRGQYQVQQAMIGAAQRDKDAQLKAATTGQKDDHMVNRVMTAADMGATQLSNIAAMNFGVSSGFLPSLLGAGAPGASSGTGLLDMTKGSLYNTLTPEDTQMYNSMAANMYRPLSILESGGGIQGAQRISDKIEKALTIRPTDSPMTVLTKLAETRQIIESGSDIYLKANSTDPGVKAALQDKLDKLKAAIPWTPGDVIAFKKAQETNPQLTFGQFAKQLGVPGAKDKEQTAAASAPPQLNKDGNGTAGVQF